MARTSSREAVLALEDAASSSGVRLSVLAFEMPALLTSRSSRPCSARIRSAAAAIERVLR